MPFAKPLFVVALPCLLAVILNVSPRAAASDAASPPSAPPWLDEATGALEGELVTTYGEGQQERAHRGLAQVASFWREGDGDRSAFEALVRTYFAGDQASLDALFSRFERIDEQLDGHLNLMIVALRRQSDLDLGPVRPFDELFAAYDPSAHLLDDFFANRLAFVALLNFPLTTLQERVEKGPEWSRREWAEVRLAQRFSKRIPAPVQQAISAAGAAADQYIAEYNIWMHHLLDADGNRLFPPGMKLLSHWNLRDEIKASYGDAEHGLAKQRMIQKVMERIVTQTIPEVVVNDPWVDWNPSTNRVRPAAVTDAPGEPPARLEASSEREPDTRYAVLLDTFLASRQVDPYSPTAPTLIARRFDENREIPEARVEKMFEEVLTSPLLFRVARLVEQRLGRPLEAFDIWYDGFTPRSAYSQEKLDALVAERYPTAEAYERDIPRMLQELGFPGEDAAAIAADIVVEPARGSGHAWGAQMREARQRLRTRVGAGGMDYKGYNIAVHEMGHNVEQHFSLDTMDYYHLAGVPNTAFTEALAFVFQGHDLELLGLASPDAESRALKALDDFWGAAEIAAVALVDMRVWHWMYDHPEASPAELREATLGIAREVWNRYWAPVLGVRDSALLAIYSHMIHSFLYLPDYPLGHMIAFQVEAQMEESGAVGPDFERMCATGDVLPDLWMEKATGSPVGPEALLDATGKALEALELGSGEM